VVTTNALVAVGFGRAAEFGHRARRLCIRLNGCLRPIVVPLVLGQTFDAGKLYLGGMVMPYRARH